MKQSTIKTLGVAALGAVFAAVGTSAAEAAAPDPTAALSAVTKNLPGAQTALATTLNPTTQAAQKVVAGTGPVRQARQILGAVPTDRVHTPLSTGVLPLG
ncbi:hypothetical protein GCM10018793_26420 [Streptomyces sulfonofaciens]|uniref:Secreted protein n=1 Tax=Streptomyces sulfonofaciens TaxID=68272 RepID=A0A919KY85_9ACTN|nr:ATP-binding protein [Streptomyces sulfonofaciens]GHH77695.1 hypothetical protein GCM10018793_26420 [Streptomyces sulfonofaciens]